MTVPPDNIPPINRAQSPSSGEPASPSSEERISEVAGRTNLSPGEQRATLEGRVRVPETPPLSVDAGIDTVERYLDQWVSEGETRERRQEAKEIIMVFLRSQTTEDPSNGLSLCDLHLRSLPDIFNLAAFSTRLKNLDLCSNELSLLPTTIAQLTSLKRLDLSGNPLVSLPSNIAQLTSLEFIALHSNHELTGLPNEVLNLPQTCAIFLTEGVLSQAVVDRIRESSEATGYQGPRITYHRPLDIDDFENPGSTNPVTIQELLQELYTATGRAYEPLNNIPGSVVGESELKSWLSRLNRIGDYNSSPQRKQWLINNVLKYLKRADEDSKFREQFAAIIRGASTTCGDRMTLSILHLGIAYKLATIDLKDMKALADFLGRGVWAMEMLELRARQKIPTLRFFDEIEVYLGYPIKLKERLQLPIDVEGMLYFACSALSQSDLDDAYDFVSGNLANKEAYYNFLVNHGKWNEALALKYPSAYAAIKRTRESKAETATTSEEYGKLQAEYIAGLVDLTKKALI